MNNEYRKTMTLIIICFFFWISCILCYPEKIYAESLTFSGLQCKTPEFKPYLEKGEFSYFLNQPASVTAEIQDKDFSLIRKIQFMKMEKAGENVILWDGRDGKNDFVKSGEYVLSVRAVGDSASAVAASMEMKIAFNAPKGTELKEHVSQIEGKEKKEYPKEVRTKLRSINKFCTYIWGPIYYLGSRALSIAFAPLMVLLTASDPEVGTIACLWPFFLDDKEKEDLCLQTFHDHEEYERIYRKVDEHNAKIDAEITEENHQIDDYNQKIKNSIIIKISPIE